MSAFAPEIVEAVLAHMNGDHGDDSLRIVQASGHPDATAAVMVGLDPDAGHWSATTSGGVQDVRIAWPAGRITERAEIRRAVVALHDAACVSLGVVPPTH